MHFYIQNQKLLLIMFNLQINYMLTKSIYNFTKFETKKNILFKHAFACFVLAFEYIIKGSNLLCLWNEQPLRN